MENLFEKKICQNCKKEFYASETTDDCLLSSSCKTEYKMEKDKLDLELTQKKPKNDWINLDKLINKDDK